MVRDRASIASSAVGRGRSRARAASVDSRAMTTIEDLVALVPPPTEPVDARGDWHEVEAALGLALPADFKALIERYGLGQFVDHITPLTPFGAHGLLIERAQ